MKKGYNNKKMIDNNKKFKILAANNNKIVHNYNKKRMKSQENNKWQINLKLWLHNFQ